MGDGRDERILKDVKKERQQQCQLMPRVAVTSLLSASVVKSDQGQDEERLCVAVI